jgi:hypothetical protein
MVGCLMNNELKWFVRNWLYPIWFSFPPHVMRDWKPVSQDGQSPCRASNRLPSAYKSEALLLGSIWCIRSGCCQTRPVTRLCPNTQPWIRNLYRKIAYKLVTYRPHYLTYTFCKLWPKKFLLNRWPVSLIAKHDCRYAMMARPCRWLWL